MKKISFLILTLILISSCNSKQNSSEFKDLNNKLIEKENQISILQEQIKKLENDKKSRKEKQNSDYYRFIETSDSEINVAEKLQSGEKKLIDKKDFNDTLDISDNFFVYNHTSEITQTSKSEFESILRDFVQIKSKYANDFFVKVMTFQNGKSLPLETENSKNDIHILIQPTELGYENKSFVVSDFFNVELKSLEKKNNSFELIFEHGKFPRKKESIIISPEKVKFLSNSQNDIIGSNIDSNFNSFIQVFNKDSLFQVSRIKFPLIIDTIDEDNEYKEIKDTIQKRDYKLINLEYYDLYKTRSTDQYDQLIEIGKNKVTIKQRGIDNGIHDDYYFEKLKGKWMLVSWNDSSM